MNRTIFLTYKPLKTCWKINWQYVKIFKSLFRQNPKLRASLVAQLVKNQPAMQENWVQSSGLEDSLKKGKATHSSILAWRIPWSIPSMGSQRAGQTERLSLSLFNPEVVRWTLAIGAGSKTFCGSKTRKLFAWLKDYFIWESLVDCLWLVVLRFWFLNPEMLMGFSLGLLSLGCYLIANYFASKVVIAEKGNSEQICYSKIHRHPGILF